MDIRAVLLYLQLPVVCVPTLTSIRDLNSSQPIPSTPAGGRDEDHEYSSIPPIPENSPNDLRAGHSSGRIGCAGCRRRRRRGRRRRRRGRRWPRRWKRRGRGRRRRRRSLPRSSPPPARAARRVPSTSPKDVAGALATEPNRRGRRCCPRRAAARRLLYSRIVQSVRAPGRRRSASTRRT